MDTISPGQNLGPYRIIEQIGQGGMAAVYKAYHAAMDRYVAVKVLPGQFAQSREFMGRFQLEARTIANLEHPHILPVHDYGESGGVTYLVMRYLDTGTLKDRIIGGGLGLAEIDRFFSQLAEALGYAHQRGVIHRDIKPSNVLVDQRGDVFLTDFGIAKLVEGASQFTATGAITGTPAYMSPEQAQGEKLDQRSDIYSLGIILYEMATGRVPFDAETPLAVLLKHMQAPLPLPSSIKPGLSPAIEQVLLKALAKNREDRFATCEDFLAAWKSALSREDTVRPAVRPGSDETIPAGAPAAAAPRKLPVGWIIGGAAALALAAAAALVLTQLNRAAPPAVTEAATAPPIVATAAPPAALGPAPETEAPWTSWAAANSVYAVAARGDEIYAAGPGGVTVWNREGSVARRHTTADGLPSARVNTLFVDDDGSLWVGTDAGLARFDGSRWTIYTTEDGLDSDVISVVTRIGGLLIVGTNYSYAGGGLNLFDGASWSAAPDFPSASPDEQPDQLSYGVSAVAADPSGAWLVGTANGLGRYDGAAWTRISTADGLPDNQITSILIGDEGALIGTNGGVAAVRDGTVRPIEPLSGVSVSGMVRDANGNLWFSGGGLWRFDPANANWETYSAATGELPSYTMFGAAIDQDGILYFGSEAGGLARYDGATFATWAVPNVPTQAAYGKILAAPDGLLWFVQEYGANVDRFDLRAETWSPYYGLPCGCDSIVFDSNGNLWAGEYNSGLWIIGAGGETHVSADQGWPAEYQVRAVAFAPDGAAWIGTDRGLAVYDGASVAQIYDAQSAGFANDNVRALLAASDGSMWVANDEGVSRLTPEGEWEHYGVGRPFNYTVPVTALAEDADGQIWAATSGDGLFRFADGKWQQFSSAAAGVRLPSPYVNSITVAPDGDLWFGTNKGAARFDGDEWASFGLADGLISLTVNDIYVDGEGAVWFATGGGVSRFRP